jgi:hypothetical protein
MKNSRIGKLLAAALFVPLLLGAFVAIKPEANQLGARQLMTDFPVPWPGVTAG